MPVIFPPEPGADSDSPRPPGAIVWIAIFAVVMAGGIVIALLTWPKTDPTNTPWFWIRLFVLPAVVFGLAFGLRLLYYEQELERLKAEDDARQRDTEKAVQFASEPLAVLGCAYLSGLGSANLASKIAQGDTALEAQTAASGAEGVRHTALESIQGETLAARYRACFDELIAMTRPKIEALPHDVPLDVRLHVPDGPERDVQLEAWRESWRQSSLRRAESTPLPVEQGLMALDEWLDIKGGQSLEKFALFVAVQLHDTPPAGSGEAAVAVLLGWAPLAARRELDATAMLHRPVEVLTDDVPDVVSTAVSWGNAAVQDVKDLWEAGLDSGDASTLLDAASAAKLGATAGAGLERLHDLDAAVGHPGICAGWLAVVAAIEHGAQVGSPQCIAWRESTLRLAIIQTVAQAEEQVETNA
ncbi:hypothetical protein [Burkholderia anthina]|uniref:hypothetical protein n=1 Tax=Burkholderia anthina TaxID=179879 RepID=UPI001AA010F2|nr:hypothetical protein [Burkholderia anthina]QTD93123.1 hypothetical protein J4G50_19780 [Burkholderia anthina]